MTMRVLVVFCLCKLRWVCSEHCKGLLAVMAWKMMCNSNADAGLYDCDLQLNPAHILYVCQCVSKCLLQCMCQCSTDHLGVQCVDQSIHTMNLMHMTSTLTLTPITLHFIWVCLLVDASDSGQPSESMHTTTSMQLQHVTQEVTERLCKLQR